MLYVNMELLPHGKTEGHKSLVKIGIANIGNNTEGTYNYAYVIIEPKPIAGEPIYAYGIVKNYHRDAPGVALLDKVLKFALI